jgi:hypothetical protein
MARTWVLDTGTKGTGANVVPLEELDQQAGAEPRQPSRPANTGPARERTRARTPRKSARRTATALPPGHVRKKATGEIGKVRSVDPKAGTAVVQWLKRGETSTVRVSAITRR